jgi:hypothetical protein
MVVNTEVRVLLVAMAVLGVALGIIAVLGALGSASPNNSDEEGATLTVVGKNPQREQTLGAGSTRTHPGRFTPHQRLHLPPSTSIYNESAKERIGRFDLYCAP